MKQFSLMIMFLAGLIAIIVPCLVAWLISDTLDQLPGLGSLTLLLIPIISIALGVAFLGVARWLRRIHFVLRTDFYDLLTGFGVGTIVFSILLTLVFTVTLLPALTQTERTFDQTTWRLAGCSRTRTEMLQDLTTHYLIPGKTTRADVETLLGLPTDLGEYCVGPEAGFLVPVDTIFLHITYDQTNHLFQVSQSVN